MFVFSKSIGEKTGNLAVNRAQWRALELERNASAQAAADFLARTQFRGDAENVPYLDAVNAVDDIRRLYRAFDTTVLQQFEPNTEFTLLNDLMPLSRSVRIEHSRYDYARTGGRGWAHTSMSGQVGAALDARSYSFDGTMVPIHDSGFKFEWRDQSSTARRHCSRSRMRSVVPLKMFSVVTLTTFSTASVTKLATSQCSTA